MYSVQSAESTSLPDNVFDLITVAQAIHWFDFDRFYNEAYRTIKNRGILALIGYGLISTFHPADQILDDFYQNIVGPFWDKERTYIEKKYQTIPFPFNEIESPGFSINYEWTFDQVIGFLDTWSAVGHYRKRTGKDPVDRIYHDLKACWGGNVHKVSFPVFVRIGRIYK
ncbi:MAG: methyltransferase domain-containing protein [Balneolales bacterium]